MTVDEALLTAVQFAEVARDEARVGDAQAAWSNSAVSQAYSNLVIVTALQKLLEIIKGKDHE